MGIALIKVRAYVRACVCVCARVRARVCVYVRACACVCSLTMFYLLHHASV